MKDNGNFPFLANQTGKLSCLWHHGKHSYTTRERGTLGVMSAQLKPSILELSSQYTPITEGCFNVATNILAPNLKDDILKMIMK